MFQRRQGKTFSFLKYSKANFSEQIQCYVNLSMDLKLHSRIHHLASALGKKPMCDIASRQTGYGELYAAATSSPEISQVNLKQTSGYSNWVVWGFPNADFELGAEVGKKEEVDCTRPNHVRRSGWMTSICH